MSAKLHTLKDITQASGVAYKTVNIWAAKGKIPVSYSRPTKLGKVSRLFSPEDFAKAVEILKATKPPEEVPKKDKSAEVPLALRVILAKLTEGQEAYREELQALRSDVVGALAILNQRMEAQLNALANLTGEVRELRKDLNTAWDMQKG